MLFTARSSVLFMYYILFILLITFNHSIQEENVSLETKNNIYTDICIFSYTENLTILKVFVMNLYGVVHLHVEYNLKVELENAKNQKMKRVLVHL